MNLSRSRNGMSVLVLATLCALVGAAPAAGRGADHSDARAGEPLSLSASLSDRRLIVRDGDSSLSFAVAVGKDDKPTPTGTFRIRKIVWNPAWVPPDEKWAKGKTPQPPGAKANPMKLVKIFFKEPDYYIHGTNDLKSLGDAASHGCLRMDPDDAYRVARYLMEHGGQPRDENWFWRVVHFRSETKTVFLDNPISIVISE